DRHVGRLLEAVESASLLEDLGDDSLLGDALQEIMQHHPLVVPCHGLTCLREDLAGRHAGRRELIADLAVKLEHRQMRLRDDMMLRAMNWTVSMHRAGTAVLWPAGSSGLASFIAPASSCSGASSTAIGSRFGNIRPNIPGSSCPESESRNCRVGWRPALPWPGWTFTCVAITSSNRMLGEEGYRCVAMSGQ